MKKAIFPGTFYNFHEGHIDILKKALNIFDEVFVVISKNINKVEKISIEDRYRDVLDKLKDFKNVTVLKNENMLTVDFAKKMGVKFLVRGLRTDKDFNFELDLFNANKELNPEIETVFLISDLEKQDISSSSMREVNFFRKNK